MNMNHIYRELEKTNASSCIHKFTVLVEGDFKEVYVNNYLIAKINSTTKTFYTKYKLMGDVILFSRYLKGLGYKSVNHPEKTNSSPIMYVENIHSNSINTH